MSAKLDRGFPGYVRTVHDLVRKSTIMISEEKANRRCKDFRLPKILMLLVSVDHIKTIWLSYEYLMIMEDHRNRYIFCSFKIAHKVEKQPHTPSSAN